MTDARPWPRARLSRLVADVVDGPFGSNLASEHYTDDGARVVRLGDIRAGSFKDEDRAFISLEHFAALKRHEVLPGDLLVAGLGDEQNALGRACIAPKGLGPALVKADCFRFRLHPRLDRRYAMWYLNSMAAAADIELEARGATRLRATPSAIAAISVPLPSVDEQRLVAAFLDDQVARLDRLLALRERQSAVLMERGDGAVRSLLTGQSRPDLVETGSRWFPRLPDRWGVMELKHRWQVFDCKHRTPNYRHEGYPLVSTGDISAGRLDLTRTSRFVDQVDFLDLADSLRRPVRGDIVYSRNASLGTASYVGTDEPFTMGQDVCRITSSDDQLYLSHVLNFLVSDQVEEESIGSTFKRINIDRIRRLEVPVPPAAEQEEVARAVDEVLAETDKAIAPLNRSKELLLERRGALITAAVTGQFDITTAGAVA